MVKKIMKFFGYVVLFFAMVLFFLPKENLYYLAEKELQPYGVVLSDEELHDRGLFFEIENAKVYFKNILAAKVQEADVKVFLLYNSFTCKDIYLSSFVANYLPQKIEYLTLGYSLLNPTEIKVEAKGEFGALSGAIMLDEKKIQLFLKPSKKMLSHHRQSLRQLKKLPSGEYRYEQAL